MKRSHGLSCRMIRMGVEGSRTWAEGFPIQRISGPVLRRSGFLPNRLAHDQAKRTQENIFDGSSLAVRAGRPAMGPQRRAVQLRA